MGMKRTYLVDNNFYQNVEKFLYNADWPEMTALNLGIR